MLTIGVDIKSIVEKVDTAGHEAEHAERRKRFEESVAMRQHSGSAGCREDEQVL
jgi:hypothetical protein